MSIDTKVRNVRFICAIVATTSIAYAVNYVRKTRDILSHAFDMSIVEEFEEFEPTPKSYSYTTWITPKYETKGIFHQFCSFFKFVYAKRLLNLAKSEDQMLRIRAVKHLAQLNLDEWECAIIAHMCDARTAVGLARSMTNPENCHKYFLQTPRVYGSYNNQLLLHTIKDFMRLMYKDPNNSPHGCLQKTISKIFLQAYDINRIIDSDHGTEALSYVGKENEDVLPLCLETVRHHSAIPKYSMDVMKYMGLYLLMEVHLRYPDDLNINIPLCQIITNLSTHPELLQEIYKTGWLPVLSKWVFHPDVRISGPASQALTNLDLDSSQEKYSPNIFLLHPRGRSDERILVDVVFVHGLLGSVFYTWRNGRSCSKFLDLVGKKKGHQIGEKG